MKPNYARAAVAAALLCLSLTSPAQEPPAPKLKEQMRQPWTRNDTSFFKNWQIAGPFACKLESECADIAGGEANAAPGVAGIKWEPNGSWGDVVGLGGEHGKITFATVTITRAQAGKARLALGSSNGIRAWVNGKPVFAHDGQRTMVPDENQVEIDLEQGDNILLLKTWANAAFAARVLESGTLLAPYAEIGPSILRDSANGFTVKTDINEARRTLEPVTLEVIQPGGKVLFNATAPRGAEVAVDASGWSAGPVEVRATTRTARGHLFVTHLPWYKGDALARARELAAEAAKADDAKPEGFTLKMLANMVDDRLGVKVADAKENSWWLIHSPLMEFEELMLERRGETGRVRPFGFVRLAWRDEVDDTPQYCRAYLPAGYDKSKPWPTVLQLHGYNPANPVYWDWWSADNRGYIHTDYEGRGDVIYIEPHGRGNTQYLALGDSDVLRCLSEAKRLFSVDENRVYLTGDSMGGWGTWNVSTRHPDLFAAIAPVFGGVDYHSQRSEEELAAFDAVDHFWQDKDSSWSMADSLVNLPIYVHHGDRDMAVNVEWSRYGVRMLQRWGYDVRYHEYPGKVHESLGPYGNADLSIPWFLEHRRDPNPVKVRIRSAELRNAKAYWASVRAAASPLAFMVVDAEVVDRNVIRLDTQNVLDIVLTPRAPLIDPARPVKVVWNGVPRDVAPAKGELRLTDTGYKPAPLHKTASLPGGLNDFYVTPFAVVIGTTAKDPEMKELVRTRAQLFVDGWIGWQKFPPREFTDSEMSDADIARYSLLLYGGPGENAVTAKLAAKLPVRISANGIRIDGKEYKVKDAALQMLYPNPRNPERYVWLVAGTSIGGMVHANPTVSNVSDWDYFIQDGHIPARGITASEKQLAVVSGMFDYNWRHADALASPGASQVRAQGRQITRASKDFRIAPERLAACAGKFQIMGGPELEFRVDAGKLKVNVDGIDRELMPVTETLFYVQRDNVTVEFLPDASGQLNELWGFNGNEFTGKRVP